MGNINSEAPPPSSPEPATAVCADQEKYTKSLRRWLKYPDGNTEYGVTLYSKLAACYEAQGNIAQAEQHLIEAYKLLRNADLTNRAADLAERLYLLLWNQTVTGRGNEHKAQAWRNLCDQLRRQTYRNF